MWPLTHYLSFFDHDLMPCSTLTIGCCHDVSATPESTEVDRNVAHPSAYGYIENPPPGKVEYLNMAQKRWASQRDGAIGRVG